MREYSISIDVNKDYEKWKNFVTEKQLGGVQLFADKDWSSDFITSFGMVSFFIRPYVIFGL